MGTWRLGEPPRRGLYSAFVRHFFRVDIELLLAAYVLDPNNQGKWLTDEAVNIALKKIGIILMQSKGVGSGPSTETDSTGDEASIDACSSEFKNT